ncbi:MAG: hypothetical protein BGP06_18140 [Rhizobiales bacterium 65-9]|nr:MAG: hypothetical protein BGP06_18140 [Rhizobiales bacterium 65-9]
MTDAERKLWSRLKDIPLPKSHFRRQAPVGPYFADFVCHDAKLVIEIDGEHHAFPENATRDVKRTAALNAYGYSVLRFWNHEILGDVDAAADTIYATLTDPDFHCDSLMRVSPSIIPPHRKRGEGNRR